MPLKWEAQTLRLSLFLKEPMAAGQNVWQLFTGQEPEVDERRAKESLHRQAGAWRAGLLETKVTPVRIDALFAPPPVTAMTAIEMPRLTTGPWRDEMASFCDRSAALLKEIRIASTRIALGATFVAAAPSRADAYEQLRRCLTNVEVVPDRMRDLIYRVNWPVMFDGPPVLELNRLTTWTVEQFTLAVVQTPGQDQVFGEQHFTKLELDHNSTATNSVALEAGLLVAILEKLRALAFENCERGERP